MLIVVALVSLLGLSSCSAEISCVECRNFTDAAITLLTGEESVQEQQELLIGELCWGAADPQTCVSFLTDYWTQVAQAAWPYMVYEAKACNELMHCRFREWSCGECRQILAFISDDFLNPMTIESVVKYLQGEAFCANGENHGLSDCSMYMSMLMPSAMPLLGRLVVVGEEGICQDLLNVC